jgi:MtN3 and saliva related transmembrane protein
MIVDVSLADWLSAAAALLTTAAFLPQAVQVIRTRDTRAISLAMYAMFTVGVALWEAYGLMTGQWSIIIANAITLVLASVILGLKLRDVIGIKPAA